MSPLLIDFLFHIRDECDFAMSLVADTKQEVFIADPISRRAAVRSLEIIGEAVKHLPKHLLEQRTGIPWSRFARMRDRLAHGYFDIDYDFVWEALTLHVPGLREVILIMIQEMEGNHP